MNKRRVPAALHFELTEYASLLRALRTREAMDLTAHLTKPSPSTGRKRDNWTRWPLLLQDVPIPEWTLEDEVAVIASRVIKAPTFPVSQGPLEHDDPSHTDYVMNTQCDEDDPDHPVYVPHLTSIIASLLSTVFSLLARHTPARPASMQNRIEPLNWRSVIDVIVGCGISEYANPRVIANVIRRMEAIHGPLEGKMATNSYRAVERIETKKAEADRIHNLLEESMTDFFSQASPPPHKSAPPLKRRRDQVLSPDERDYKLRKHWVPKAKRDQEDEMGYNSEKAPQKPSRRSARAKSEVNYK